MEIWVDENIPLGQGLFGPHGKVTPFAGRSLKREDILQADALIVRSVTKVDEGLLAGTRVRFVATATIGTDHVDLAWLKARGIGFTSAPGCNANSVGDYVTAALIHLERKAGLGHVLPGQAVPGAGDGLVKAPPGFPLEGKTLGIIGYGNVGKRVAVKAQALGMSVVKCDPPLMETDPDPEAFLSLDALLERSDVVTLHVPLTRGGRHPTHRMADSGFFARLSRPILFINTCRGETVVEADLLAARESGKVSSMVLDVFDREPLIDRAICAAADLITPHIAGYSVQGKVGGTFQVAEAFRRFFSLPTPVLPPWPVPENPDIVFNATGMDTESVVEAEAEFLSACVRRAYDIEADDARLRAALREADPGKAFDRLRREYPVRHEHQAYRVTGLSGANQALGSRLQGLGFRHG